MRAIRRFTVRPVLPEALLPLGELAGNLRWSWHPPTQDLFASIDSAGGDLWQRSRQDPTRMLGLVPTARLEELGGLTDALATAAPVAAAVNALSGILTLGNVETSARAGVVIIRTRAVATSIQA